MKRKKYFIDNSYLNWLFKFMIASLYGLLSALGINLFLNSAHSYSIGIPGIAQLLNGILVMSHIDLSIATLIILLNIPLVIFSWFIFGSSYTFFSLVAVISNVLFLHLIPETSVITERLTNTLVGSVIIWNWNRILFSKWLFYRRNRCYCELYPTKIPPKYWVCEYYH